MAAVGHTGAAWRAELLGAGYAGSAGPCRTSKALGSLVAKQLVSRVQPAGDRRQVQVALTDAGRALYEALFPRVAALNAELLACLDAGQAQALDAALARLQTQAGQMVATLGETLPKADRRRGRPAA